MELLRLFPSVAMIGDSLASGEIVHDDDRALGVLFGGLHPDRGVVNEGPACVDCYENSWCSLICRRIGAKVTHFTKGGCTAKYWLETYNYHFAIDKNKYPLVFIALGSNDFGCFKLGEKDHGLKENTFAGYYNEIIKSVRHYNPEGVILCLSLYRKGDDTIKNQYGDTLMDWSNMIKDITGNYKKCYYLDFVNESENEFGKTKFERRGHYSAPGYLAVADDIERIANKVLEENIKDLEDISLYI
ncbi:MAG: SGNH/GDSL hydrolase family protein [Abditibacteriota bacterium]|nr:SGNH/GDSL hydrolase family protein [Abditibacteriota bacterium]